MGIYYKALSVPLLVLLTAILIPMLFPSSHNVLVSLPYAKTVGDYIHKLIKDVPKYLGISSPSASKPKKRKKERIFTEEDLKLYDGTSETKELYLAILGQVFDVKKGKKYYGPGGGYAFFSAKDGTRAFVSGDFTDEGLTDDVAGLSSQDLIGIDDWIKFYHKDYKYIGKLIGRYYDSQGNPTEYNLKVKEWIAEAYADRDAQHIEKNMFPPCNHEWYQESGSRVWCTRMSGGVSRNWVGVPRKYYSAGQKQSRCACIKDFGPPSHDPERESHNNRGDLDLPNLNEYPDCPPTEESCTVPHNAL